MATRRVSECVPGIVPPGGAPGQLHLHAAAGRQKIAESDLLDVLIKYATGESKLSPRQVSAGLALIKKVIPDLKPVSPSAGDDDRDGTHDQGRTAPFIYRIVDPNQ